jgi:glycosyltransferase involved in cell wall biosynthesis
MKILYSFNKKGFEANYWTREIAMATSAACEFIPFNHDPYLDPNRYIRAQLLDNLYYENHPGLSRMYTDLSQRILETGAEALLVDNCPPYHPEFLRKLRVYKVLRIADGPLASYDRDFAYLHAYDHVLYHSHAYSRDMGMAEKLHYCGAKKMDFWPLASFDALCEPSKTEADLFSTKRDIDVIFIGTLPINKMPLIAAVKKSMGKRLCLHGLVNFKQNIYFNLKFRFPGWVTPLPFENYVSFYQRAKIGINVHNRGDYSVGSYRLFDLPANGVMQISDGGEWLDHFFEVGEEIESYTNANELLEKLRYYLTHDEERERIALNGLRRVRKDYKISNLLNKVCSIIRKGMAEKDLTKV